MVEEKKVDLKEIKRREPFRPGKGKYGHVLYNQLCYHCGKNGHTIKDCMKKKDLQESKSQAKSSSSKKQDSSSISTVSNTVSMQETRIEKTVSIPRKAKLSWVPKN